METKTKKALLIGSIILLIVINISALSTIYYHNKIQEKKFVKMENMREEARVRGMRRFIGDELKLSDEQFEQFKEISRTNMISAHEINQKLNRNRYLMMNEVAKENPNQDTLDNIAKEIGSLHYELKRNTINHFLELKKICNDDQQEDLQNLFMQMLNGDQNDSKRNQRDRQRNSRNQGHNRNKGQGRTN